MQGLIDALPSLRLLLFGVPLAGLALFAAGMRPGSWMARRLAWCDRWIARISSRAWLGLVTAAFGVYSGVYIYRSSFIGLDGRRYFSLFDDAMISMRYAWNLTHGRGLVWNEGVRVEGITNLLMTLVMAVGTALFDKVTAVVFVQVLGVVFLLASAYLSMRIASVVLPPHHRLLDVAVFGLSLTYYPLVYWVLLGMETGLLMVLLLAATWVVLRPGDHAGRRPALPLLLGLAFMTRPGALVPAGVIYLYRLAVIAKTRGWWQALALEGAILAAIVGGVSLFRLAYYGSVVPNTYTLKVDGFPLDYRLENGASYTRLFLDSIAAALPLMLAYPLLARPGQRRAAWLLLALFSSLVAYQVWAGGDAWPTWRLPAPFIPLAFVLCVGTVAEVGPRLLAWLERRVGGSLALDQGVAVTLLAVALMVPVIYRANWHFIREAVLLDVPTTVESSRQNLNQALALDAVTTGEATIAVIWGGTLPYYLDRTAIDMLGKSDEHIAQSPPHLQGRAEYVGMQSRPGHNKYDLQYSIIELQPTFVQSLSWDGHRVDPPNYRGFNYQDTRLILNVDSNAVRWDLLTPLE